METEIGPTDGVCRLLLTDGEGWAGLYDSSDATRRRLGQNFGYAELAGDRPFENAYLIPPHGAVLPAASKSHRSTTFDAEGYASAYCIFSATDATGTEWTYALSWSVDGRA